MQNKRNTNTCNLEKVFEAQSASRAFSSFGPAPHPATQKFQDFLLYEFFTFDKLCAIIISCSVRKRAFFRLFVKFALPCYCPICALKNRDRRIWIRNFLAAFGQTMSTQNRFMAAVASPPDNIRRGCNCSQLETAATDAHVK